MEVGHARYMERVLLSLHTDISSPRKNDIRVSLGGSGFRERARAGAAAMTAFWTRSSANEVNKESVTRERSSASCAIERFGESVRSPFLANAQKSRQRLLLSIGEPLPIGMVEREGRTRRVPLGVNTSWCGCPEVAEP